VTSARLLSAPVTESGAEVPAASASKSQAAALNTGPSQSDGVRSQGRSSVPWCHSNRQQPKPRLGGGRTNKRTSTRYRRTRQTVLRARPLRAAKGYTRLFAFLISLREGGSQTVLHCAHQGSTFRSCDLGEQEEWSGCCPPPPKLARCHSPCIARTESPLYSEGGRADSQLRTSRGIPPLPPSHAMRKDSRLLLTSPSRQYRIIT